MGHGLRTAAGVAGVAGYVNAVAYLGLHAFVAPMTGTIVLAASALANGDVGEAGRELAVILGFMLGILAARLLRRFGRPPGPGWALSALLLGAAATQPLDGLVSLVPIGMALGCLNGSETRFGAVVLNTTFMTGNLERLGEAVADKSFANRAESIRLIVAIVLAYGAGALAGALAARGLPLPLLPPAGVLALWAFLRWRHPA